MKQFVTPIRPADDEAVQSAATLLRAGRLVAFPTETVYGLGANAQDAVAVRRIFAAKGRPASNPLIVHVPDVPGARNVAADWPDVAEQLAAAFWPGPLTLVLPKRGDIPDEVTAGGPTVAVRCPNHIVARRLLLAAGLPLAAPSANPSNQLSPTTAEHVRDGLDGRIDLILDGGPCVGGIESTVVDLTGPVRVLRPGLISISQLEAVLGRSVASGPADHSIARSPGGLAQHYCPRTPVVLVETNAEARRLREAVGTGWLSLGDGGDANLPEDPNRYAAGLYAVLHALDARGFERLIVTLPPDTPEWAGVRDRLLRAASLTDGP